jgi:hypothetical protein
MLLVVIENALDRLDTRVFVTFVGLPSRLLMPVEDLVQRTNSLYKLTEYESM